MSELRNLRTQPPDIQDDGSLCAPPPEEISDPAFESLLNELVQRYQVLLRAEKAAAPESEPLAEPPLIASTLLPNPIAESHAAEPEPTTESRDSEARDLETREPEPSPRMSDAAFESLLNDLVEQYREAFRTESAALPPQTNSPEPSPALPIPPSLMPHHMAESTPAELETSTRWRGLLMPVLTALVVGLAMVLGLLLGIHQAHRVAIHTLKGRDTAAPRSAVATPSVATPTLPTPTPPSNTQTVTKQIEPVDHSYQTTAAQRTDRRVHRQPHPHGGLTVYKNDQVIFHLPPS
jgi:hypothetical protein